MRSCVLLRNFNIVKKEGVFLQIDETLLNAKYIYLDWNVIKYMKEPRLNKGELDKEFKDTVFKLKKKYKFPYSFAHIKDRANRYSEEYYDQVKEDFEFAETVNDTICVEIDRDRPILVKETMQTCFNEYLSKLSEEISSIDGSFPFTFNVNMDKIDETHPMYEFLRERNGEISSKGMEEFLQGLYSAIFQDNRKYKKLRDYVNNFDFEHAIDQEYSFGELIYFDKLLYHMFPFLDSFKDDESTLLKKWSRIANHWFSLNNTELRMDLLLIQGYSLLDMHPLFKEKLKKGKNTLDNIIRDGNHCFYASRAKYFISEDENTRIKTAFLYRAYGIKTKVVSEQEFLNCVQV